MISASSTYDGGHFSDRYSDNTLATAIDLERRFSSFAASLASRRREAEVAAAEVRPQHKWGAEERELHATLVARRTDVRQRALCDPRA